MVGVGHNIQEVLRKTCVLMFRVVMLVVVVKMTPEKLRKVGWTRQDVGLIRTCCHYFDKSILRLCGVVTNA